MTSASVTVDGITTRGTVSLPFSWDRLHSGRPGLATFALAFPMAQQPGEPYALYLVRLGNAYEILLNGTLL